jgi:hypothetical protein
MFSQSKSGLSLPSVFAAAMLVASSAAAWTTTVDPPAVMGGTSTKVTVDLIRPMSSAISVALVSSVPRAASVPATVTVPRMASSFSYVVTTSPVARDTDANITASVDGKVANSATVRVLAASLSALTLVPIDPDTGTSVGGPRPNGSPVDPVSTGPGASATNLWVFRPYGKVTLSGPAPAGGYAFQISSNNVSAQVPATGSVAAGTTSAYFEITTSPVGSMATGSAAISVSAPGVTPLVQLLKIVPNPLTP